MNNYTVRRVYTEEREEVFFVKAESLEDAIAQVNSGNEEPVENETNYSDLTLQDAYEGWGVADRF